MDHRTIVLTGIFASIVVNALLSTVTSPATLPAMTPLGIIVYLLLGLAIPQFVLSQRTDAPGALGRSALCTIAAALVFTAAHLDNGLTSDWGAQFVTVLLLVVFGVLLGTTIRAFARGYAR